MELKKVKNLNENLKNVKQFKQFKQLFKRNSMTIVSAYISNVNKRSMDYITYGSTLLSCNIPKIIFVDEVVYPQLKDYENEITKIIQISKTDIYLYKYSQLQLQLNSTNLDKDT